MPTFVRIGDGRRFVLAPLKNKNIGITNINAGSAANAFVRIYYRGHGLVLLGDNFIILKFNICSSEEVGIKQELSYY